MKRYVPPWVFGIAAGVLFVGAEVFLSVYPPSAYAFCLTCHTRDLLNRIVNALFGTNYQVSFISTRILFLSSPAILLGAFAAARINGERKVLKADKPLRFFVFGFIVMVIGILIFGCPTRLILRSGYGDVYAAAGVAAMFAGIACGTLIIKRRAVRPRGGGE
jgi:hypothetical protein